MEVGALSLGDYAAEMTAPHRMDLMLSAMRRSGVWHCQPEVPALLLPPASPWRSAPELSTSSGWTSSAACGRPISRR